MQEFLIVIHKAEEGGYWAEVPALEGCFAQGETLDEVIADMRGAIASHLEALRADGQSVPSGADILIASIALPAA